MAGYEIYVGEGMPITDAPGAPAPVCTCGGPRAYTPVQGDFPSPAEEVTHD